MLKIGWLRRKEKGALFGAKGSGFGRCTNSVGGLSCILSIALPIRFEHFGPAAKKETTAIVSHNSSYYLKKIINYNWQ